MHPWLLESLRKEYNSLLIFFSWGGMFYVNLAVGGRDVGKLPNNDFFSRTNTDKSLSNSGHSFAACQAALGELSGES